jgi:ubiquinone/menaquinone biosynthesis C-methylase UbiE
VFEALQLRSRERVLEVGCGGGAYAYEAAQCVGSTGRVCAVDLSADQIASTKARCAELAWVECQVADAVTLPYWTCTGLADTWVKLPTLRVAAAARTLWD